MAIFYRVITCPHQVPIHIIVETEKPDDHKTFDEAKRHALSQLEARIVEQQADPERKSDDQSPDTDLEFLQIWAAALEMCSDWDAYDLGLDQPIRYWGSRPINLGLVAGRTFFRWLVENHRDELTNPDVEFFYRLSAELDGIDPRHYERN